MSYIANIRPKDKWGRELHDAICANCKQPTQVTFLPKPEKDRSYARPAGVSAEQQLNLAALGRKDKDPKPAPLPD